MSFCCTSFYDSANFQKSSVSSYLTILIIEEAGVELTFDTFYKEGYNNKSRDL